MAAAASKEAEVNLTPLLDVVLQLIMFFLLTTQQLGKERFNKQILLPVTQELVTKDEEDRFDKQFFINIDKDSIIKNIVALPEGKQSREAIRTYFKTEMEDYIRPAQMKGRKALFVVLLRADKEARYNKVFDVLEAGRLAGKELAADVEFKLRGMKASEKK